MPKPSTAKNGPCKRVEKEVFMDIEVYADEHEELMLLIFSPEYQEPEPPPSPCGGCGGSGVSHTVTEVVDNPFGDEPWEDHHEVPCKACAGTGQQLEDAA